MFSQLRALKLRLALGMDTRYQSMFTDLAVTLNTQSDSFKMLKERVYILDSGKRASHICSCASHGSLSHH